MDVQPPLGKAAFLGSANRTDVRIHFRRSSERTTASLVVRSEDGGGHAVGGVGLTPAGASVFLRSRSLAPNRTDVRIHFHNFCHHEGGKNGGGGGIRTHGRFPYGGFQDRCHKPLDHPSRDGFHRARAGGSAQILLRFRRRFKRNPQESARHGDQARESSWKTWPET
jgi:hypothetical protein